MRFRKEINQALKIVLVFAVITSAFDFLEKLSSFIPIGNNKVSMENFFRLNIIWFISIILIIIGLCIYIKKADGIFNLIFIYNPIIRITSGFLIIFDGIINLLNKSSVLLFNVQTFHQASSFVENVDELIRNVIISNIIPILTNLLQVLFGLYFVFTRKNT